MTGLLALATGCGSTQDLEGKLSNERGSVVGDKTINTGYGFDITSGEGKKYPIIVIKGTKPLPQLAEELKGRNKVRARNSFKVTDGKGNPLYYLVASDNVEYADK